MNPSAVLLDTHVVLWALQDPDRLGSAREIIQDAAVTRYLSAACVWEVAIKTTLNRLELPMTVVRWAQQAVTDLAAERVPVTDVHAAAVADLPPHHRDPFDRILVAQACSLDVPIVTADAAFARYDVTTIGLRSAGSTSGG
jgi:PIN domain nuclease of toxin-antitoxin system